MPNIISLPHEKIIWCYTQWQSAYDQRPSTVQFQHGVPEIDELRKCKGKPMLIELDDLMSEIKNDAIKSKCFARDCHH